MFNIDFMTADVIQFLSLEGAMELAFQMLIKPLICCKKLDIENACFCCSNTEVPVISYAVAIGMAPIPELLFSMGMVIYCACVSPKIQS